MKFPVLVVTILALTFAPPVAIAGNTTAVLPDAPSASRYADADPADSSQPHRSLCGSTDTASAGSLGQLAKRGLQDQCRIYTAPFHRSAVKWDVGVLAMSAALIAA